MTRTISFSSSFYSFLLLRRPQLCNHLRQQQMHEDYTDLSSTNSFSSSLLPPICLVLGYALLRIFFGWNLSVNCVNFLDLENAVCFGLRLMSLTWLPREGNLNLTSQQMCIRLVTGHASFPYKYLNSLSTCILPCWNQRGDKRHRADAQLGDPTPRQQQRTAPRPQTHFT